MGSYILALFSQADEAQGRPVGTTQLGELPALLSSKTGSHLVQTQFWYSFSAASRNTHEELKIQKLHQHGNDYLQIHICNTGSNSSLLCIKDRLGARRTNSGEIHLSSPLANLKQCKQLLQAYFCPWEHNAVNSPGSSSLQPKQTNGNFRAATLFLQVNYSYILLSHEHQTKVAIKTIHNVQKEKAKTKRYKTRVCICQQPAACAITTGKEDFWVLILQVCLR